MSLLSKKKDPLDDLAVQGLIDRAGLTDQPPELGIWEGFTKATVQGFPRGLIEAKGALQSVALETTGFMMSKEDEIAVGDAAQQTFEDSRKYRPNPITVGTAGQISNELTAIVPRTVVGTVTGGPAGGAVAAGVPAGFSESDRLQSEGVDSATANTAGVVTGLTTGIGAVLPGGGFAKSAWTDASIAAGGNVALGVVQRKSVHEILADGGYHDMAAQYQAFDKTAMATDLGFSLILSGAHRLTTPQTNAILTNRNAESFSHGDGIVPTDAKSGTAIEAAKTEALDALLSDKPFDVSGIVRDASFIRNPRATKPSLPEEVHTQIDESIMESDAFEYTADRIIGLESNGKANAKNPRSSATGAGQFIESTWLSMIQKHRSDLIPAPLAEKLKGKSFTKIRADKALMAELEPIFQMRNDASLSRDMVIQYGRENGKALEAAGFKATPANVYMAHHFGSAGAVKLLRAAPDTKVFDLLSGSEKKANPAYRDKTVSQMMASFERRAGKRGAQLEFPKNEPPVVSGERSAFEQPDVVIAQEFKARAREVGATDFMAETLAPKAPRDSVTGYYDARVDHVKADVLGRAQAHIRSSGEPGYFVSADLHNLGGINAFEGNVAERANSHYAEFTRILKEELEATGGDVVPMRTGGDELGAVVINADADKLDLAIQNTEARIQEYAQGKGLADIPHHKGDTYARGTGLHIGAAAIQPSRTIAEIFERADRGVNISKQRGKSNVRTIETSQAQSITPDAGRTQQAGQGSGSEIRSGSDAGNARYPERASQPDGARVANDPVIEAVQRAAQENPDQSVLAGFDADERPQYRKLSEVLAEIQAEQAKAFRDARAYMAGANCYLKNGA